MKIVAWEITKRCFLKCRHCRAGAENTYYENELSLDEAKLIIDSLAEENPLLLIITGGEPLLRADIFDIVNYASSKEIMVVMATCGALITKEVLEKLKKSGVAKLSFSIDGYDADSHDEFRGQKGAFADVVRAANLARGHVMPFQINTTIIKSNFQYIEKLNNLAIELGADLHDIFIMVPTGRADNIRSELLDNIQYDEVLKWIAAEVLTGRRKIRVTCAPHYSRIFKEASVRLGISVKSQNRPPSPCMGGKKFFFISNTGKLYPCGFFPIEGGDLRKAKYSFSIAEKESKLFSELKDQKLYLGKCSVCLYFSSCSGCRARALAINGDYLREEPFCSYVPESYTKSQSNCALLEGSTSSEPQISGRYEECPSTFKI